MECGVSIRWSDPLALDPAGVPPYHPMNAGIPLPCSPHRSVFLGADDGVRSGRRDVPARRPRDRHERRMLPLPRSGPRQSPAGFDRGLRRLPSPGRRSVEGRAVRRLRSPPEAIAENEPGRPLLPRVACRFRDIVPRLSRRKRGAGVPLRVRVRRLSRERGRPDVVPVLPQVIARRRLPFSR
jgi:hypothetical protein